jgi:RimJ/RimL family protein N-acetyltransferase
MAEAFGVLTGFASNVLLLRRLTADVAGESDRAQRLFKKLGDTAGT